MPWVGYQATSSRGRNRRIYDWDSLVLEALQKLLMWAPHDIKKTNYDKSVSGLCRLFTLTFSHPGSDFEAKDPFTILSVSKRNGLQPPPAHIKPITYGNELRTYDMVPYLKKTSK